MIKYYYIPAHHEDFISKMQSSWLLQSEKAYTIMTGVYDLYNAEYLGETVDTTVLDQQRNRIPKKHFYQDEDFGLVRAELIAFCLEANSNDVPVNLPPDVLVFNDNIEFLKYIHE